jgi:hypothetical protein
MQCPKRADAVWNINGVRRMLSREHLVRILHPDHHSKSARRPMNASSSARRMRSGVKRCCRRKARVFCRMQCCPVSARTYDGFQGSESMKLLSKGFDDCRYELRRMTHRCNSLLRGRLTYNRHDPVLHEARLAVIEQECALRKTIEHGLPDHLSLRSCCAGREPEHEIDDGCFCFAHQVTTRCGTGFQTRFRRAIEDCSD